MKTPTHPQRTYRSRAARRLTLATTAGALALAACSSSPQDVAPSTSPTAAPTGASDPSSSPEDTGLDFVAQVIAFGADSDWEGNRTGQVEVPTIGELGGFGGVVDVAAGMYHSLAIRQDGTVAAWGSYADGEGRRTVDVWVPDDLTDVVAVDGGFGHDIALKADGTVVAWGQDNQAGQVTVPEGLSDVVAISTSSATSYAVKGDGTIVGWGSNPCGQLDGLDELTGVVDVAAGVCHAVILFEDGTIQLQGFPVNQDYDMLDWDDPTLVPPPDVLPVVAVAANNWHSLALQDDGTVVAWGDDTDGAVTVPEGLHDVVDVAAGWWHSVALTADGTVVAWGNNGVGQTDISSWPEAALIFEGQVEAIAADGANTLVLAPFVMQLAPGSWVVGIPGDSQD
jgi:alpha-tubulin suppressor-like RCC1 family protein